MNLQNLKSYHSPDSINENHKCSHVNTQTQDISADPTCASNKLKKIKAFWRAGEEKMAPVPVEYKVDQRPHALCVPFPLQGHLNMMLKLAKLLHYSGFCITFVNTEYNHDRLLRSQGPEKLNGVPGFHFETIPDGLPLVNGDVTQDIPSLCDSTSRTCSVHLRALVTKLQNPPVTCIVADSVMTCAADAARDIRVPFLLFSTIAASAFSATYHFDRLVDEGLIPLQESQLTNGYLERTTIDFIPGMEGIRLKDLPTLMRVTSCDDLIFMFARKETRRASKADTIILNTFDPLEEDVIDGLRRIYPKVVTVGPMHLAMKQVPCNSPLHRIGSNLWKEESECLKWLNSKAANSVIYVNYGSITVLSPHQLIEFAWGLANSKCSFLWIIRPDLIVGTNGTSILPAKFADETKERGMLAGWCPQEEVLNHPSIGGFLTHCGWNSTIESLAAGVPMICWPFAADQQTNCWFVCSKWGVGMEIDTEVKREQVEETVRELMEGDKGKEMRNKAAYWKSLAVEAVSPNGSSTTNFKKIVNELLQSPLNC